MSTEKKNLIDDGFRADLVRTAEFAGVFEIPAIKAPREFIIPRDTIPFSLRNQTRDYSEFVVFYEHDIRFADILLATDDYLDETWCDYLHNECKDDWLVVNFACHYWDYAHDRYVPDPIHFIAYLYYRVDTAKNGRACEIFDSLAITILPNAGLLDMMEEPNYAAERDPRIQAEIALIKSQEAKQ